MNRFCVFSGFLGSGKTTAMIALTEYCSAKGVKASIIANDLGHGVNLADCRLAGLKGCSSHEITDGCICYQNDRLAETLNKLYNEGSSLVISDIPGFGIGALEHVYHGLDEKYPGRFKLAPFTVLVEPGTIEALREGGDPDLDYIRRSQLAEADLIVLNKCDTLSPDEAEVHAEWLRKNYRDAEVILISALNGTGLDSLYSALTGGAASMRRPDIGYGGEVFSSAMNRISEYYYQYRALVCCESFNGTEYLKNLAEEIRIDVKDAGYSIPHLKLLAWSPDGDYGKIDLTGEDMNNLTSRSFSGPCTDIAVILNASAVCPSALLDEIITGAAFGISAKYQLELTPFRKECFGIGG